MQQKVRAPLIGASVCWALAIAAMPATPARAAGHESARPSEPAARESTARRSDTPAAEEKPESRRERAASRKGRDSMTSDEAIEQLSVRIAEKLSAMKAAERPATDKRPDGTRSEGNRLILQNSARPAARGGEHAPHEAVRPAGTEMRPTYQRAYYKEPVPTTRSSNDEAAAFAAAHRRANGAAISTAAGFAAPATPAAGPAPATPARLAAAAQGSAAHGQESSGAKGHGAAAVPAAHGPAHLPHWSYAGESGPDQWARLHPEYARCSTGQRQSPIDIRDGFRVDLENISFDYHPSAFRVIDNGHTVQVNLAAGSGLTISGRRYELVQFHFHRPSEERINGKQYEMVAHLVHKDSEGRLAVVAVLIERGTPQPVIQTVWNNLPLEQGEEVTAQVTLDTGRLLPDDRSYFTYMGSLTTPPCTEGVLWMVLKQPVQVSEQQIAIFSRLYPMNARPTQAAAGRMIKESN